MNLNVFKEPKAVRAACFLYFSFGSAKLNNSEENYYLFLLTMELFQIRESAG